MPKRSLIAFVILSFALAACAVAKHATLAGNYAAYVPDPKGRTASVDWTKAEAIHMELSNYELTPQQRIFKTGKAYVLTLRNDDTITHSLKSIPFFQAIAVRDLIVYGKDGEVIANPRLEKITLKAETNAEIKFVAVRTGAFDVYCDQPLHATRGMTGNFVIE